MFIPQTQPGSCKVCDPNAVCFNGSRVAPKPGYWRNTNVSENFYRCPNFDACLGGGYLNNESTGICATGYEGVLCGQC